MTDQDLRDYMQINYPYELVRDPEHGGFFAEHPDLPGCAAQGETADEAVRILDEAREAWIEARIEGGQPVPKPLSDDYSGRISLRMDPSLHEQLAREASRRGLSLNLLLNTILARHAGGVAVGDQLRATFSELLKQRDTFPIAANRHAEQYGVIVRAATVAFRHGDRVLVADLLALLPQRRQARFLLALLCLERSSQEYYYQEGVGYCNAAYEEGLTDDEAAEVLKYMPQAPRPEDFKRIILPRALEHDDRASSHGNECRLIASLEHHGKRPERAEAWRKRARAFTLSTRGAVG